MLILEKSNLINIIWRLLWRYLCMLFLPRELRRGLWEEWSCQKHSCGGKRLLGCWEIFYGFSVVAFENWLFILCLTFSVVETILKSMLTDVIVFWHGYSSLAWFMEQTQQKFFCWLYSSFCLFLHETWWQLDHLKTTLKVKTLSAI